MTTRRSEKTRPVGDLMVFFGSLIAILLPALSLAALFSGGEPNPLMLFGGAIVGLLLMGVGYLKRIAHASPGA